MSIHHETVELTSDFSPVPGFPGFYVNKDGVVGKKISDDKLRIYKYDRRKTTQLRDENNKLHRLRQSHIVARTFLEGYDPSVRIQYKDGDVLNGCLDNIFIQKIEDFEKEVWKTIPSYPDYEISSEMRVRSKPRVQIVEQKGTTYERVYPGRYMSPCLNRWGQHTVCMHDESGKIFSVTLESIFRKLFDQ